MTTSTLIVNYRLQHSHADPRTCSNNIMQNFIQKDQVGIVMTSYSIYKSNYPNY